MSDTYTSRDTDAVFVVTEITFLDQNAINIVERTGGIDCDNGGRAYSHEEYISYQDLMWKVMNQISFYGVEGITASITGTESIASRPGDVREIRIVLPSDDPESFGTVWTITPKENLEK